MYIRANKFNREQPFTLHGKLRNAKRKENSLSLLAVFTLVIVVFALLQGIYEVIAPRFAYMYQFKLNFIDRSSRLLVVPYLLAITLFLYLQQKRSSLSDFFLIILTLCYFLPSGILFLNGNWNNTYYLFHLLSYISLCLVNELIPNFQVQVPKNSNKQYRYIIQILSVIIAVSIILITFIYNGIRINLNLDDVYKMREEWTTSSMPNIFNYYIPFAARITPVLLLISLNEKQKLISVLLIISQLVSFTFGGMKFTLFALLLGLLFYFFRNKMNTRMLLFAYVLFVVLCWIECFFTPKDGLPMFSIYSIRRISFVSNQIGFYYFDFFKHRDFLYYSDSFLRWFIRYPYSQSFTHVIGDHAFGFPEMGANTGLFAEGFSQIGWLSIPVYSFLYIAVARLFSATDLLFKNRGMGYVPILAITLYVSTFIDGSFFSVLLTQGAILTLIFLYIIARNISYARE